MRLQTHCSTFVVFLDIHHEHPHVGFASANLVKLIYFPPFLIKFMDQAKAKRDQDRPQRSETAPGPHRDRAGTAQTWRRLEGTRRNTREEHGPPALWAARCRPNSESISLVDEKCPVRPAMAAGIGTVTGAVMLLFIVNERSRQP